MSDENPTVAIDFTKMTDEGLLLYLEAASRNTVQAEAALEHRKMYLNAATYEACRRGILEVGRSD